MFNLDEILTKLQPKNIWEIGVGNPNICRARPYFNSPIELKLFEVNPATYNQLVGAFYAVSNVRIYNFGLYDKNDTIEFLDDGDSTCSSEVESPTVVLGGVKMGEEWVKAKNRVKMEVRDMSEIDDGEIDVALIDTEGCEFKIVSRMKSRPRFMSLESHNEWYKTPNSDLLDKWLADNNYKRVGGDATDSYYLRNDVVI